MTVGEYKKQAEKTLQKAGIGMAELDVLVLLEDLLHTNRAQLLAHPEHKLTIEQQRVLDSQIERRAKHEPLAYIRGKVEFYGYEFMVNKHVLVPRPETETMLEMLRNMKPSVIIDVGTGSGAIAVIAKKMFPSKEVIAIDNDPTCLEVTRENAEMHSATLTALQNDLLDNLAIIDGMVILANLPYVPNDFGINKAALQEPHQAIFGGPDGLDLYRRLFSQLKDARVTVLTESLPIQHKEVAQIAQENGYRLKKTVDFIQQFAATAL